jgi:methylphosphotriester-DNA--protein-cysteine methyltransferase
MKINLTRRLRIILITVAVALCLYGSFGYSVGSVRTHKYHQIYCKWAWKIKAKNKVRFWIRWQAESEGYIACKVCHPLTPVRD